MYNELKQLITELGDTIISEAGTVSDIGTEKQWLTERDLEIETRLSNFIMEHDPEAQIYAEELHDNFVQAKSVWIIDPISSTYNFINGLPHFTVVASHMKEGKVVFAVVYDPSTKELFSAEKGKGVYLNGRQTGVRNRSDLTILIGGSFERKLFNEKLYSLFTLGTVRVLGSVALHYAYVACGRVSVAYSNNKDTFPEFAGKLLVEEGGGIFTDAEGNPLTHECKGIIAASSKENHGKILKILEVK
jgi:myo-inositol-1(or 4)-monophosphatase